MNEDIFKLEEDFQPYLLENHYTFTGPQDMRLSEGFIKNANLIAPVVAMSRSIHHALSNRNATRAALQYLPPHTRLRVFIVIPMKEDNMLVHSTIEDYCKKFDIDYVAK